MKKFDILNQISKIGVVAVVRGNSKEEAINNINNLNLDIQDGFKINDTVYLKEELKLWVNLNY